MPQPTPREIAVRLAALMTSGPDNAPLWEPADIAAIFDHQLTTPLRVELATLDETTRARLRQVCERGGLLLRSIGDLLHHANPPAELLRIIKDFAKTSLEHPDSALPKDVSAALYWLCLASGLVHGHQRLSSLEDPQLRDGFEWAASRAWIGGHNASLLREAAATLGEVPSCPQEEGA